MPNPTSNPPQPAASSGKPFWRTLEELTDNAAFRKFVERHLPRGIPPRMDELSRRRFLTLLGASMGLAGLAGCDLAPPTEKIIPYVRQPEQLLLGRPLFYATTMISGGTAVGLLAESHEGRPTKLEGNPEHPASLGATDVWAQAAVLSLYDPDRAVSVTHLGQVQTLDAALQAIRQALGGQRHGAGLRLLTETVVSPTLGARIEALLRQFPQARWHQYEPLNRDAARAGARLALGQDVNAYYRLDQADVILALDADFLLTGPGHLCYARHFADGRNPGSVRFGKRAEANRLYAVECMPSITGAKADHRWALRAGDVELFARHLAAALAERFKSLANSGGPLIPQPHFEALLADLRRTGPRAVVIPGEQQPPAVHALAHVMNDALGAAGKTVVYTDPVETLPTDHMASLRELADDLDRGRVEVLLILGGNPIYTAPADLELQRRLTAADAQGKPRVPLRVHLGMYYDETSQTCHWHIPEAHFLESWGDGRAFDGTASTAQPLVAPLYGGRSLLEVVSAVAGQPELSGHALVHETWRRWWQEHGPAGKPLSNKPPSKEPSGRFEAFWRRAVHDGVIAGTALPTRTMPLKSDGIEQLRQSGPAAAGPTAADSLELVFRPDPTLGDGRWANNGWLQELPKPLTRLTWGNAALMSYATAERLGIAAPKPTGHGGEHGDAAAEIVEVSLLGRTLRVPAFIVPGHADGTVTLHLGGGRTRAGNVGNAVGVNAYALRTSKALWSAPGAELRPTGEHGTLACVQFHHLMENRDPVHTTTVAQQKQLPKVLTEGKAAPEEHQEHPSLYPGFAYDGYKWGLSIDLTTCIGCNACVVACQSENNIPVVGHEQVEKGREMHWIRLDTYYQGNEADLRSGRFATFFEPVPCMQCENAPCELVCPVGATVHSDEGLNDMVYNRCVGTRYCSNNCPYKVRRFNFLPYSDFTTESLKLLRNPEVTVRSRGVMEKCTYCVQRIVRARVTAEEQNRRVRDGEILTACQAACPAQAIVFGDLNDKHSQVARLAENPLNFTLLDELNTRPRTTYLAAVRNPNPAIEGA